jgi:hypothetical protein
LAAQAVANKLTSDKALLERVGNGTREIGESVTGGKNGVSSEIAESGEPIQCGFGLGEDEVAVPV